MTPRAMIPIVLAVGTVWGGEAGDADPENRATNWPQHRHDARQRGFNRLEEGIDRSNVESLSLLWEVEAGNTAFDSMVVANGRVYAAYAFAQGLYVRDAETGALLWRADAGTAPAVSRGMVLFVQNGLTALDAETGTLIWEVPIDGGATPTVAGDTAYVPTSDGISAVDVEAGVLRWEAVGGDFRGTVAVSGDRVIAQDQSGDLWAFDAGTGALLWFRDLKGLIAGVQKSPVVIRDTVYVSSTESGIMAFDAATGAKLWSALTSEFGTHLASPAAAYGLVYFPSSPNWMYAVDAGTGAERWEQRLGECCGISSSPAVANELLFVNVASDDLTVLDALTGEVLLRERAVAQFSTSPVVSDGTVFVFPPGGGLAAYAPEG